MRNITNFKKLMTKSLDLMLNSNNEFYKDCVPAETARDDETITLNEDSVFQRKK